LLAPLFTLKALQSTTVSRLPPRSDVGAAAQQGWTWLMRQRPWTTGVAKSSAWDADGRCVAATTHGLVFWNGTDWRPALRPGSLPCEIAGTARTGPARWLLTGEGGRLFELSTEGLRELPQCPDPTLQLGPASGAMNDMVVIAATARDGSTLLLTMTSVGWLAPRRATDLGVINAVARCSATQWLVAGRSPSGNGVVVLFSPLEGSMRRLEAPARAYVACAGDLERGVGIAVGTDGACVVYDEAGVRKERVQAGIHLSAAAVDLSGGYWASGANQLFYRGPAAGSEWRPVWQSEGWSPFISMFADSGVLLAVTSDGAVLEGEAHGARRLP
jgi:hypothetical protein